MNIPRLPLIASPQQTKPPAEDPLAQELARDFEYQEPPKHSPLWQLVRDIGETIILTLVMFLVIRLAVQDYQVDGTSMVPTLQNTQYVLVDKITYNFNHPQHGDVIVFEFPGDHSLNYVKRIIGLPGDRIITTANGIVKVNGVTLNEPYINDTQNPFGDESVTVTADHYWVMGDNRGASSDSRQWGLVSKSEIIGKAALVYWPFSALHFLPSEQQVFQQVVHASGIGQLPQTTHPAGSEDPLMVITLLVLFPVAGGIVRLKTIYLNRRRDTQLRHP